MGGGPPEGWYEDPKVPGQERWWDGRQWSMERVRPKRPALIEPPQLASDVQPRAPLAAGAPPGPWPLAERPAPRVDRDEVLALLGELQAVEERLRALQLGLRTLLSEVGEAVEGRR